MCLIIEKPAGRRIPAEFLAHAWQRNAHGWGVCHREAGRLAWRKGLVLDELTACNDALPLHAQAWLHLRQATYGPVQADMAHPHVVRPGLLLMHNGSIHHLAPQDASRSDSAELAAVLRELLAGLDDARAASLLRSDGFRRLTAPLLKGSMVVLVDGQGAVRLGRDWHVVGRDEWHGDMQGVRVSNTHAWTPLCTGPWQQVWRALRRGWASRVVHPWAARSATGRA